MADGVEPHGSTPRATSVDHQPSGGNPLLQTSAPARIDPAELARAQQVVANISRSFDAKVVGQARLRDPSWWA
ncbi:UNVERIFIED_ORG: hypothetical protein ABIB21_002075 [Arthrobacter sp. UYEF13]